MLRVYLVAAYAGYGSAYAVADDAMNFDALWQQAIVFRNDSHPILQQFKWRGRYHGQFYDVDANTGKANSWDDRRARFGFDALLWDKQLELRAEFQSNDGFEEIYDGLTDAFLRWKPSSSLSITLGKQQVLIGDYEWMISANTFPAIERSQLFSQLAVNRATGLTMNGNHEGFLWQAGLYSNVTPNNTGGSGDWGDGEWGDFDGGYSMSCGLGYLWKTGEKQHTSLRADWLHSEREAGDLELGRYDDIVSGTLVIRHARWQVVAEAYHASGGDGRDENVFGCYVMPTYDIVPERWQLVARYNISLGDGPESLSVKSRYEREAVPALELSDIRGDEYHAVYLGAQYFLYGDKLKWMAGVEWAQLQRDGDTIYRGTTAMTGLRFSF